MRGGVAGTFVPHDQLADREASVTQAFRDGEVARIRGGQASDRPEGSVELPAGVVRPADLAEDVAELLVGHGQVEVGCRAAGAASHLVEPADRRGEQSLADRPGRRGIAQLLLDVRDQPAVSIDQELAPVDGRLFGRLRPPQRLA